LLQGARFALASLAMLQFSVLGPLTDRAQAHEKERTRTPIKHVIVGENRSFGHLFATYKRKNIANGTLPAVSFVKPSGWVDGHPASSKWDLFEGDICDCG
jgi:phospholipase C